MQQIYEYHPAMGFRFTPHLKSRVPHDGGGYLVRANAQGFRSDRPFEKAKKPGVRRILLFGDSFTAGEGVSNGQRYGDWLEKMIPHVEVFNFGMPATGTDQHYLIYKEFARDIEHDLMIIGVFVENIRRVASRYRHFLDDQGRFVLYAKPYFTLEGGDLTLHGAPPPKAPVREEDLPAEARRHIFTQARYPRMRETFMKLRDHPLFERAVVKSGLKETVMRLMRYKPLTEYDDPNGAPWRVMRAIIRVWVGQHDRPVMLVPIPIYHYVAGISSARTYQRRLREAVTGAGGYFEDPLAGLMAHSRAERHDFFYHKSDGHLTKLGHEAMAKCLAPAVEALLNK
jgi:carbamoyltransferase